MIDEERTMALLRDANPVTSDEPAAPAPAERLASILANPRRGSRSTGQRRLVLAGVTLLLTLAAALTGALVAHALDSAPGAGSVTAPVTASEAASVLGTPLLLPNTSVASSADVDTMTEQCPAQPPNDTADCVIQVTFHSSSVIARYSPKAPADPLAEYQAAVADDSGAAQIAYLSGVPVEVIAENPDNTTDTATYILFVVNGISISVVGHDSVATMEGVANSIIAQASGS